MTQDTSNTAPTMHFDAIQGRHLSHSDLPEQSRALNAGLVRQNDGKGFTDETVSLLQSRLTAAAINLSIVLGIGYVGNLFAKESPWLLLRTAILLSIFGCLWTLRRFRPLSLIRLRLIETILFDAVAVQMLLMMYSRITYFANQDDAVSMTGAQQFYFTAFCLHILTYGIFMPNTWKRAAIVTTIFACLPYALWYSLCYFNPIVAQMGALNQSSTPLPTTFIAALIGTFGSHIINRTRREAYKAKRILQYQLQELIGSGGMGEVYRAEHLLLKRRCAIKLIKEDKVNNANVLERFEREVIATARLTHWNTIQIYDYGHTDGGTFYYVMELLEGDSIQTVVDRTGPISVPRSIHLLKQVCEALNEAHGVGLIHRDIKPANIFLTSKGGFHDIVKVLDFGLVKQEQIQSSEVATAGRFSGTPAYMAPEQAVRYEEVDCRADIYAIGAFAYFMLAGRPPFSGRSTTELILAHATLPVPSLRASNPKILAELESIILRCLEKEPDDRFQSTATLRDALEQIVVESPWSEAAASNWWKNHFEAISNEKTVAVMNDKTHLLASHGNTDVTEQR